MANTSVQSAAPTHDEIAAHAYEIYLREGCVPGRDFDHWLQAEAELRNGKSSSNGNGNGAGHDILKAPATPAAATVSTKSITAPARATKPRAAARR